MALTLNPDYTGLTRGKWYVIERVPGTTNGSRWRCRCVCGVVRIKSGHAIGAMNVRQCAACQRKEKKAMLERQITRYRAIRAMYKHQDAPRGSS